MLLAERERNRVIHRHYSHHENTVDLLISFQRRRTSKRRQGEENLKESIQTRPVRLTDAIPSSSSSFQRHHLLDFNLACTSWNESPSLGLMALIWFNLLISSQSGVFLQASTVHLLWEIWATLIRSLWVVILISLRFLRSWMIPVILISLRLLRSWVIPVIMCWLVWDVSTYMLCNRSHPISIWQEFHLSNLATLRLLCQLESLETLTWCVEKNVAVDNHHTVDFGKRLIGSNLDFVQMQQAAIHIEPLTHDLEYIRDGFGTLKRYVALSDLPLKDEMEIILHRLKDGTRLLQFKMSWFNILVGRAVRLQLWASRETAELLEQYGQSSSSWEKTNHWLPLFPRQYFWLKRLFQPSTIRQIPDRIKSQSDFMSPCLTNLTKASSEIALFLTEQLDFVDLVERYSLKSPGKSPGMVKASVKDLVSNRNPLAKVLMGLKWTPDDTNLFRSQIAALNHMDVNYRFAKHFFDQLHSQILDMTHRNEELKDFEININEMLGLQMKNQEEWSGKTEGADQKNKGRKKSSVRDWELKESEFKKDMIKISLGMAQSAGLLNEQNEDLMQRKNH